ncbi:MAG: TQO small subunit DoxD [Ktedonobacteraceae bacterium]
MKTNQPNPSYQSGQVNQPEKPETIHMAKWVLLPMRLFLGITFIYAGLQKLADPQFFSPAARGYIGKQIMAFATGSPLHDILIRIVPHAAFFGSLVAYGEIAIGLGTLLGLLFRPAAFFGILINLLFFLSATWHVYPYFYGSDIVFIFCWLTLLISGPVNTGLPSLDQWLVRRVLPDEQRTHYAAMIAFFLGIRSLSAPLPVPATANQGQSRQTTGNKRPAQQNRYAQVQRAKQQSRRNFLWGMLTGGAGIAVLAWLGSNLHLFPGSQTDSGSSSTGSSTPSAPATGTATATGTLSSPEIARVNAVQNNSAVNFTLTSNGDPGILVRLNNGQFVAYDAVCTHAGCPVDYDPSSQLLVCPCHGAAFDPAKSAAVAQGPAATPLTGVPIHINNTTGAITAGQ